MQNFFMCMTLRSEEGCLSGMFGRVASIDAEWTGNKAVYVSRDMEALSLFP